MATQVTLNSGSVDSAGSLSLKTNGTTTAVTIDTSQNVGIAGRGSITAGNLTGSGNGMHLYFDTATNTGFIKGFHAGVDDRAIRMDALNLQFATSGVERARITSGGELLVGKTASDVGTVGARITSSGTLLASTSSEVGLFVNRNTTDGILISFRQDNSDEGNISVSGTTVSYNGGHLSRWAQTTTAKDESLVKGTVLSNLDEMNVYTDADGNPVQNEQLNKVKVSDVEGDANVAGVFVNWEHDEAHNVDEINMAMTGDMIIRIAQGVTVQRGDLLMSAGDGTAKPQGDDIVRSKTIAKVTSTHVTCTYADGSFCVPCVLMAC
jgi:hypothetical protein